MNILFLLKKNNEYGYQIGVRSGLYNSVQMLVKELRKTYQTNVEMEICIDGNSIDRYLHKHKPRIAIIEAIWVTPEKLKELTELHKRTLFIVRLHSETPFLANEGIAVERINEYAKLSRVYVSFNSLEAMYDFQYLHPLYLPNVYASQHLPCIDCSKLETIWRRRYKEELNVGCFGAIRPMKNQLQQALTAIKFAEYVGKTLNFHINATRTEQKGDNVLKNLRALFKDSPHKLVEHPWMEREDFLKVVAEMDLGMQFSMSESFNIVTADLISQGVPTVVSPAIEWMPSPLKTKDFDSKSLLSALNWAYWHPRTACRKQKKALISYNEKAIKAWRLLM